MSGTTTAFEVDGLKRRLKETWMAGDYDRFSGYMEQGEASEAGFAASVSKENSTDLMMALERLVRSEKPIHPRSQRVLKKAIQSGASLSPSRTS